MKTPYFVEVDEADAFVWTVRLPFDVVNTFDESMGRQLKLWAASCKREPAITLNIRFPTTFPHAVPFVRIISPRFVFHTGHVTVGGSICTPLLTTSGWRPMNPESLIRAVMVTWKEGKAAIQVKPDMYCSSPYEDYSEAEAKEAFDRVARVHGWM